MMKIIPLFMSGAIFQTICAINTPDIEGWEENGDLVCFI